MKNRLSLETETIVRQAFDTDVILLDIVEYTLLSNEKQYQAIFYLNKIIRTITNVLELNSVLQDERIIEGFIPAGDGCYVVLNPRIAGYGPLFALSLRNFLLFNNRVLDNLFNGVRTSVHHGTVIPIDFLDTPNFVGDGLNVCPRLLSRTVSSRAKRFYKDSSIVVISRSAWEAFTARFPLHQPAVKAYLRKIQLTYSREHTLKDKHEAHPPHQFRFVDSARLIGSAPPRLTPLAG